MKRSIFSALVVFAALVSASGVLPEACDCNMSAPHARNITFRIVHGGSKDSPFTKVGLFSTTNGGQERVSFRRFVDLLKTNKSFRGRFNAAVGEMVPYTAFLFECPPVSSDTVDCVPFEFVAKPSSTLARARPTPYAFPQIQSGKGKIGAVAFPNLGNDALLISPTLYPDGMDGSASRYTHLGALARTAPSQQVDAFWSVVGNALNERLLLTSDVTSTDPVWFSTSGLGVYWTHVRLDRRPKYYTHQPYVHFRRRTRRPTNAVAVDP